MSKRYQLSSLRWAKEARDLAPDPVTGAALIRLSGSSIRTENIYCETPRATADGARFASQRYIDHLLSPHQALLCHDLRTLQTCLLDAHMTGFPVTAPWSGHIFYPRDDTLMRADLDTCTCHEVAELAECPPVQQMYTVSRDERFLIYSTLTPATNGDEEQEYNLVRLDLQQGGWEYIFDRPRSSRVGAQYDPAGGDNLILSTTFWEGDTRQGACFYMEDGRWDEEKPFMSRIHHACWLTGKKQFAGLKEYDYARMAHLPENPEGELHIFSVDGTPPRLIPAPEHLFYHISSSPCGRYVVCESLAAGLDLHPVPIVVINIETGKYRTLVTDANCSQGGDAGRQVNAFFTADMRHVIFNGDPDGVVNVYAAGIPDGFLESLH